MKHTQKIVITVIALAIVSVGLYTVFSGKTKLMKGSLGEGFKSETCDADCLSEKVDGLKTVDVLLEDLASRASIDDNKTKAEVAYGIAINNRELLDQLYVEALKGIECDFEEVIVEDDQEEVETCDLDCLKTEMADLKSIEDLKTELSVLSAKNSADVQDQEPRIAYNYAIAYRQLIDLALEKAYAAQSCVATEDVQMEEESASDEEIIYEE